MGSISPLGRREEGPRPGQAMLIAHFNARNGLRRRHPQDQSCLTIPRDNNARGREDLKDESDAEEASGGADADGLHKIDAEPGGQIKAAPRGWGLVKEGNTVMEMPEGICRCLAESSRRRDSGNDTLMQRNPKKVRAPQTRLQRFDEMARLKLTSS